MYLSDDYPPEVVSRRHQLYPILKYAKNIPKYTDTSWLSGDKLIIDGKSYSSHALHTLPTELDPMLIRTPSHDDSTVFFGCNSPFQTTTNPLSNWIASNSHVWNHIWNLESSIIQYHATLPQHNDYDIPCRYEKGCT